MRHGGNRAEALNQEFVPGTVMDLHCISRSLAPFVRVGAPGCSGVGVGFALALGGRHISKTGRDCWSWVEELLQKQGSIP